MIKKKSFNLEQPKPSEGWQKFQEWNERWNRILATVFCVLSFTLFFAIVMVNVINAERDVDDEDDNLRLSVILSIGDDEKTAGRDDLLQGCQGYKDSSTCPIVCSSVDQKKLVEALDNELKSINCSSINLSISQIDFPLKALSPGWLKTNIPVEIDILTIQDSELRYIRVGAFSEMMFLNMKIFEMRNLPIKTFMNGSFTGLFRLQSLKLESLNLLSVIEDDALSPLQNLYHFYMSGSNIDPKYLLGGTSFPNLGYIVFRMNNFSNLLNEQVFRNLPALNSLYLNDNNITWLPSGTFKNIGKTLHLLDLSGNLMTYLEPGLLSYFKDMNKGIFMANNPWICNCSLYELKERLNDPKWSGWFRDEPWCTFPAIINSMPISKAPLRCTWTTTTSSTTPEPSTTDTDTTEDTTDVSTTADSTDLTTSCYCHFSTTDSPKFISVDCFTPSCEDPYDSPNYTTSQIQVRQQSVVFSVDEISPGRVEVKMDEPLESYVLIWISNTEEHQLAISNENASIECRKSFVSMKKSIQVDDLKTGQIYLFCLMKVSATTVSPFDCLPHYIEGNETDGSTHIDDVWLTQDDKILVYSLCIVVILLFTSIGTTFAYLLANKKKTKLKRREADNSSISYDFYSSPKTSWSETGAEDDRNPSNYMTPVSYRTMRNSFSKYRPPQPRRSSDSSLDSVRSYISALAPTSPQLRYVTSWRIGNRVINDLRDVPKTPPPLPLHPRNSTCAASCLECHIRDERERSHASSGNSGDGYHYIQQEQKEQQQQQND